MTATTACRVCDGEANGAFLCKPCLREIERAIGDMPALLAELETAIARQVRIYRATHASAERESATAEPSEAASERHRRPDGTLTPYMRSKDGKIALRAFPLPVDLDAAEVRWNVRNTLGTWARHLAESRDTEPPADRTVIDWLLNNADAIRFDEAAAEIHDEITFAHREAERAVDRSPERIYAGPCRAEHVEFCCVRDLYAKPDGSLICDGHRSDRAGCRVEHSISDRNEMIRAELEGSLLPLNDALDALRYWHLAEPPRRIVNDWIRRGRLPEHELAGRPAFPLATLIELVQDYKPHRYPQTRRGRSVA